jgi:hypothetical protein
MALMDALKKATGLGLSPQELFARAYEKGVLLGPAQFSRAIELFDEAAAKAQQMGDTSIAARASANSALYRFVTSGSEQHLDPLREALRHLPDIEQVGSQTDRWPAAGLLGEIDARVQESDLNRILLSDHPNRAKAHTNVAAAFRAIFNAKLITYSFHSPDAHSGAASTRYFLHHGLANQHDALAQIGTNPEAAAESMSTALAAFRQCGDSALADNADRWLSNSRKRRTCWVCHREFQGATTHFQPYHALVTPYAERVVRELGQDSSSLSAEFATIVLCTPCSSVVQSIADTMVSARTKELGDRLAASEASVASLNARVFRLEARR